MKKFLAEILRTSTNIVQRRSLEKIYSFSSWLNVWAWNKLYNNRKEGQGYKK